MLLLSNKISLHLTRVRLLFYVTTDIFPLILTHIYLNELKIRVVLSEITQINQIAIK